MTSPNIATTVRAYEDIGMYALDRPIPTSCVHATDYCKLHCYNDKLYKLYPAMHGKDERNETAWTSMDAASVAKLDASLGRRTKLTTERFRLMTRGEAFKDHTDIERVKLLATGMPDRLIWIPTRAWRDPILRARIVAEVLPIENVVVLASLDPSNTEDEYRDLVAEGWSTMYFGRTKDGGWAGPEAAFACPKTYRGLKGHCAVCKAGCFAPRILGRRVDVNLKAH